MWFRLLLSLFLVLLAVPATPCALGAQVSGKKHRGYLKKLRRGDFPDRKDFLRVFESVLEGNDARSVRVAAKAYAKWVQKEEDTWTPRQFLSFHGKAAKVFSAVTSKAAAAEFVKLLKSNRDWRVRLLLLDASGFAEPVGQVEGSLIALGDEHPVVLRITLRYLARSRELRVVEAIILRYLEISAKRDAAPKKGSSTATRADDAESERTELIFQSTLNSMLGVELQAPQDFRNYFAGHKDDPDLLSSERRQKRDDATRVTLFGTAVTGRNIAIVLDVSGSMLTTDPSHGRRKGSGRTTSKPAGENVTPLEDQRLYRAKQELASVVGSLTSGVTFNLITFGSEVDAWQESLVPASDANKKEAVSYVHGLKADGVTVTDLALEAAFSSLELDTIYLITDGAPTHMGGAGPDLPEDTPWLILEIHRRVRELNFLRGVRIFTLGFEGAEEEFLQKLAADNSGTYARID